LQAAGDDRLDRAADQLAGFLDHDHGAVLEVRQPLPGLSTRAHDAQR